MSSDVTPGAGPITATAGVLDLADASRRLLEESFNGGNFALVDQLVAAEALNHDPALPAQMRELRGPEALKRVVSMYRAAFPDLRMTVDDVIATNDKVVLRWHSEGTHRGELAGLAPTGSRGSVTGISIDRWQDGKIVEAWAEWDNMGLARQLGAAPPEGSVGEKIGMGVQRLMARRLRCCDYFAAARNQRALARNQRNVRTYAREHGDAPLRSTCPSRFYKRCPKTARPKRAASRSHLALRPVAA